MGPPARTRRPLRPLRADEYVEVLYKLWEASWDDDAVLRDTERGIFADPAKIHEIDHVGDRYRVIGPHLSEPHRNGPRYSSRPGHRRGAVTTPQARRSNVHRRP
jgi:alkanesulfonate monooxygenase SsuD/methylene tetrahydromethanopterin reductase-like flavin-dependent oxidoreductase (luciferase family)